MILTDKKLFLILKKRVHGPFVLKMEVYCFDERKTQKFQILKDFLNVSLASLCDDTSLRNFSNM